jgi:hypothetical protein
VSSRIRSLGETFVNLFRHALPQRSKVKVTVLTLLVIAMSSSVCDAGVMLGSFEPATEMSPDSVIFQHAGEDGEVRLVVTFDQDQGMGPSSISVVTSVSLNVLGQKITEYENDTSGYWLVDPSRVTIPNPIAVCLLKVPIA